MRYHWPPTPIVDFLDYWSRETDRFMRLLDAAFEIHFRGCSDEGVLPIDRLRTPYLNAYLARTCLGEPSRVSLRHGLVPFLPETASWTCGDDRRNIRFTASHN